jgi:hypothetical protein
MPFLNGTHAAEKANSVPKPDENRVTPVSLARLNMDMVRAFLKRAALNPNQAPRFWLLDACPKQPRTFGRHA